jgi:dTDP-glucose pyrophosphorylase
MDKAVILARGLGTRMRADDSSAQLTPEQSAMASHGIKALMPIDRPFLDYVMSGLADAGYRHVCLIIGPEHDLVRDYYGSIACERIQIHFAIQEHPRGTGDAVAAAEQFAGTDPFLVINSDNYYPIEALGALRDLTSPGLPLFDRNSMLSGNIDSERISRFAVGETDADGRLLRVLEKPTPEVIDALPDPVGVSMNCWRFHSDIFDACRSIKPSQRGELELTDAVQWAIDHGQVFQSLFFEAGVLDLTSRADIETITNKLAGTQVTL